jgi:hypothetical protein
MHPDVRTPFYAGLVNRSPAIRQRSCSRNLHGIFSSQAGFDSTADSEPALEGLRRIEDSAYKVPESRSFVRRVIGQKRTRKACNTPYEHAND